MKISQYTDTDICRYLDDQMRFFDREKTRTRVSVFLNFDPFFINMELGSKHVEPSLHTLSFSQYRAVFIGWEDRYGRVYPGNDWRLKSFSWSQQYTKGCIGLQHRLPEVCQIVRDLDRIRNLKVFL